MLLDECFHLCFTAARACDDLSRYRLSLVLEELLHQRWILRLQRLGLLQLPLLRLPLRLAGMVRLDLVLLEVIKHLAWHLFESFLG